MKYPLIIIISAPSGSGKTTLVKKLLEKMPNVKQSISYTTREPRRGEKDKEDYIFISREEFKKKIDNEELVEWEENFGNYYGTSKVQFQEAVEKGIDLILSIDVKGARRLKENFPESISVFIMPPSTEELAMRLKKRNRDDEKELSIRLKEAELEIASSDEYDYLIVNKDLDKALDELKLIIEGERKRRKKKVS